MCKVSSEFIHPDPEDLQREDLERIVRLPQVHHPLLNTLTTASMVEETFTCRYPKMPPGIRGVHFVCVFVLLFLPGRSSALTGPHIITDHVASSLTVQFQYEDDYTNDDKYWCHGWSRLFCTVVVQSPNRSREGRTSIRDNPRRRTVTVTMDELREDDAGYYWCGVSVPGWDPMLSVHLMVVGGSNTENPTAAFPTKQEFPTVSSTTTDAMHEKSLDETTLEILLPIMAVLLFLLLLMASLFLRERRRRKQGMQSDISKSRNTHISGMFSDTSTFYAVIRKPENDGAMTPDNGNTSMSTEPMDSYEEIQPSPMISDSFPIYAVVKKTGDTRNQGIDNPTMDPVHLEHHYEEIQHPPVIPDTFPIYAVVKKTGDSKNQGIDNPTMDTVHLEHHYEVVQDSPMQVPGRRDVSCITLPSSATDQQTELYSTVGFHGMDLSEEPQYYLVTK